jgi:G3E family GTPase
MTDLVDAGQLAGVVTRLQQINADADVLLARHAHVELREAGSPGSQAV